MAYSRTKSHDFKQTKKATLKNYARRRGLRKGTKQYNAYVHGTVARRMAAKKRRTSK